MCVAYPGRVIATKDEGRKVTVDFSGTVVDAMTGFIPVKIGDHVLVHAGCVLQVLTEDDAKAMEEIFRDIAEIEGREGVYQDDLAGMGENPEKQDKNKQQPEKEMKPA